MAGFGVVVLLTLLRTRQPVGQHGIDVAIATLGRCLGIQADVIQQYFAHRTPLTDRSNEKDALCAGSASTGNNATFKEILEQLPGRFCSNRFFIGRSASRHPHHSIRECGRFWLLCQRLRYRVPDSGQYLVVVPCPPMSEEQLTTFLESVKSDVRAFRKSS